MWAYVVIVVLSLAVVILSLMLVKKSQWYLRRELAGILKREKERVLLGTGNPEIAGWLEEEVKRI